MRKGRSGDLDTVWIRYVCPKDASRMSNEASLLIAFPNVNFNPYVVLEAFSNKFVESCIGTE
jgi:hypothetical protein